MLNGAERNTEFGIVQLKASKITFWLPSHKVISDKTPLLWRKETVYLVTLFPWSSVVAYHETATFYPTFWSVADASWSGRAEA